MTPVEERRIKGLLKEAVVEVLKKRHDLLRKALRESLEDLAGSERFKTAKNPGS